MPPEPVPEPDPLPPLAPGLVVLESGSLPDPPGVPSPPDFGFMIMAPSDPILPDDSWPGFMVPSLGLPDPPRVVSPPLPGFVISGLPCPIAPPEPLPLPSWVCTAPPVTGEIHSPSIYKRTCAGSSYRPLSFCVQRPPSRATSCVCLANSLAERPASFTASCPCFAPCFASSLADRPASRTTFSPLS